MQWVLLKAEVFFFLPSLPLFAQGRRVELDDQLQWDHSVQGVISSSSFTPPPPPIPALN